MKKHRAGKSAASAYHRFTLSNMPEKGELLLIYVAYGNTGYCHVGKYDGRDVHYETEQGIFTLPIDNYSASRWAYLFYPNEQKK